MIKSAPRPLASVPPSGGLLRNAAKPTHSRDLARAHRNPAQAFPRAHQAARGVAHRVHRGDRHVPRDAGVAARRASSSSRRSASRWSRAPPPRSTAWSSRRSTRVMTRTRAPAAAARRAHVAADARLRRRRRRHRPRAAVPLRQRADHVAHARDVRRLRDRLHGAAQAGDAAEHRDRRRVGRDAAGAGLGGGHRRGRARGAAAVPHHLRLDAAAFLVARALPHAGLREGRGADAAGDARRAIHAAA